MQKFRKRSSGMAAMRFSSSVMAFLEVLYPRLVACPWRRPRLGGGGVAALLAGRPSVETHRAAGRWHNTGARPMSRRTSAAPRLRVHDGRHVRSGRRHCRIEPSGCVDPRIQLTDLEAQEKVGCYEVSNMIHSLPHCSRCNVQHSCRGGRMQMQMLNSREAMDIQKVLHVKRVPYLISLPPTAPPPPDGLGSPRRKKGRQQTNHHRLFQTINAWRSKHGNLRIET